MFKPVSSRVSFPELDANVLQQWKDKDVFRRTESERPDAPLFMMYEGPPTANGSPGIHHVLARVFKDVICRYRTMKGFRVQRKGGWDTHGLPVELEVEKELGLKSKRDIEEYGIEEFNKKCRESVFRYVKEWETMTDRIGYWVDMEDPYVTLHNNYIESGWWMLKTLWDKDLLYQTMRGTPHCPRCVTSLSSHEVALGYRENTPDPSVFIKFQVDPAASTGSAEVIEKLGAANTDVFLLAWTTTPWTLPGNTGLAVDETADYSIVELEGEGGSHRLVLAQALVSANIKQDHNIVGTIKGSDLVGLGYTPLYDPNEFGSQVRRFVRRPGPGGMVTELEDGGEFAPKVIAADFVSLDDGTGIVHIAPAFGDEDLGVGREKELSFVQPVDLQGIITGNYPFAGKFVKTADKEIMEDLTDRGLLYHQDIYRHTYPFCWRCDTPLLYYAKSAWYIRTSALKDQLVGGNDTINWHPNYIKDGRFGEWLRNNVDWAISRERYWGTPIPIWQCQECDHTICVGGVDELREMAGANGSLNADGLDLHRPYVDNVVLDCTSKGCSGKMHRIPEVMDAWFDSGAMPFAQYHYPFDNESIDTDGRFPADYICEAVDQTRGWFYSLHALSTLLKGQPAYKNVICLGLILDAKGRKMSKRVGNVVEPLSVLDEHGADALRWYLFTASQAGEPRRFSAKLVSETLRKVMLTVWNVYSFFIGYAEIDKFDPSQKPAGWKPENELDRWVLSELNTLISQVEGYMDGYEPTNAGRRIQEFIDQLSNWYVRRSRRRFWRNEGDADKLSGYITLHTCLVTVTKLMAPLAPFVAEEMYQNLVCSVDPSAPDSVHLSEFPVADESLVDQPLMEATQLAMKLASMGRAARSKAGLKVRQPLAKVLVKVRAPAEREYIDQVRPQVLEELNIKDIQVIEDDSPIAKQVLEQAGEETETILSVENYSVSLDGGYMVAVDGDISPELAEEGLAREVVHRIQGMRRSANFDVTDRIVTYYQGPSEFADVMQGAFADYIRDETLSTQLVDGSPDKEAATESTKIEGMEITLAVHQV
ncbi:MAG TPA: isoleucine--tRNA ligase [Dehalococcoidia bacterium]|nr:isoleucine--tRNA ligase [Dehalococcoidia bacterium]